MIIITSLMGIWTYLVGAVMLYTGASASVAGLIVGGIVLAVAYTIFKGILLLYRKFIS